MRLSLALAVLGFLFVVFMMVRPAVLASRSRDRSTKPGRDDPSDSNDNPKHLD